ncbi:MAG TPA: 5'-nucleotidase C-terminal domain-containing protein, partial [Candidatus Deferrimicrobium sp.]|nr:5'-nucleotidase C-terminal domain-containing protein [Candidatus Deferrimicrobium sp.]
PIIATNMVTDRTSGVDDGIEALEHEGAIVKKRVLELPNGLRIGILGIMGVNADVKAPAALPITFNHDYKFLQERVDALRIIDGVNIVVLLSHGGVSSAGIGDDEVIAANVPGIDIIASGHYHTATPVPFIRGNSHTVIFSPGEYGEWVSRLDVTYNTESGRIEKTDFTLIPVNDTIRVNKIFEAVINSYQGVVDQLLAPFGYSLDMPVSRLSWRMEIPGGTESGLGNLVADAVRAMASNLAALNDGNLYHVAVVPNGVIRDGLFPGKTGIVSFTDVYNTIPLGKSADAGQLLPGYPLISLYVTGADLRNICEAGLTVGALLGSDFYLNFSGIRVDYNPAKAPQLQGVRAVYLSFPDDYFTAEKGMPIDITDTQTLYHMVVNLYSLQMMNEVTRMGLTIIPRDAMGNPIAPGEYMQYRIDSGLDAGIQELKEWMALFSYLNNFFPASGEGISTAVYGNNGSAMGRIDIVNY